MTNTYILAVNSGSSSLKVSVFQRSKHPTLVLKCSITNVSSPPAKVSIKRLNNHSESEEEVGAIQDHESAFRYALDLLGREGDLKERITHVCHRVVHGGEYHDPVVLSDKTYHHIEELSDLAPLHNGPALAVISSCLQELSTAPSIAFFDTAFHRSIPPHIAQYAIDQQVAKERGLKKYGFHGISYSFILSAVSGYLKKPSSTLNLIVLHLGSGASTCAISRGVSLDTSMGLTPLSGLPGATRSGDVDPSLIFHYANKAGKMSHKEGGLANVQVTQAEQILNKQSGWKAITGTTDFGEIAKRAQEGSEDHLLAFNLFADRILHYVGSHHLKLGGQVDALVFSGGIGERSEALRSFIGSKVQCLGYAGVDISKNSAADTSHQEETVVDIGLDVGTNQREGHRLLVVRTDEQLEMARQCEDLVSTGKV